MNKTFPTYSRYEGSWSNSINNMEGFGTYTYPDGSEYRGYFRNGLFEGYGTLKQLYPQKFIIKGQFEQGVCKYIHELRFGDGLKFRGVVTDSGELDCSSWRYCTPNDRRFCDEIRFGIEPFGPCAVLTARKKPIKLPKGTFDTSEGFYQPHTGFLTRLENTCEQNKQCFIGCPKYREWICKNCRYADKEIGGFRKPREPKPEDCRKIIECNITAMSDRSEVPKCMCRFKLDCERYFGDWCSKHSKLDESSSESENNILGATPSSSSVTSFEDAPLPEAQADICVRGVKKMSIKDPAHAEKVKVMKYIN